MESGAFTEIESAVVIKLSNPKDEIENTNEQFDTHGANLSLAPLNALCGKSGHPLEKSWLLIDVWSGQGSGREAGQSQELFLQELTTPTSCGHAQAVSVTPHPVPEGLGVQSSFPHWALSVTSSPIHVPPAVKEGVCEQHIGARGNLLL